MIPIDIFRIGEWMTNPQPTLSIPEISANEATNDPAHRLLTLHLSPGSGYRLSGDPTATNTYNMSILKEWTSFTTLHRIRMN